MNNKHFFSSLMLRSVVVALLFAWLPFSANAQNNIVINLSMIDGLPVTPDNIFNYQVQSASSVSVQVKGTLHYRGSNMSISYSFNATLNQGLNSFNKDLLHPQWQFSSSALRDLFLNYKTLPEGTYEYCVKIIPVVPVKEAIGGSFDECLYHRSDGMFLINLINPENKAKLKEYNPMLAWMANCSFLNELTYRIRVAAIKQGQNPVNAVMRNQPVYDEKNLMQNSVIYPVYAKPLEPNQPYAWTVDAYFKGILLGGSETWQFIIPIDTLPVKYPAIRSYIDVKKENGVTQLPVMGELKIKYQLDKYKTDVLSLQLLNNKKEVVLIKPAFLNAVYGDNRYTINLKDSCNLKHLNEYTLIVKSKEGESHVIPFKYIDPDLDQ